MQTGGIVKKKDVDVSSINSLMRMINNDRAKIKEVSFSSLYGLIFELRIPGIKECETEFFGLNEAKSGFTRPVDALIIKMSVLSQHDEFLLPDLKLNEKVIKKQADVEKNFKKEAILQSKIYYKTLSHGEPICPAVVDLFILKSNAITTFLNAVHLKCDSSSSTVITWLKKRFAKDTLSLGVIVMESALSHKTFYNEKKHLQTFLQQGGGSIHRSVAHSRPKEHMTPNKLETISRSVERSVADSRSKEQIRDELDHRYTTLVFTLLTCVIRLYNECNIEHLDLHEGNSMVKYNDEDKTYNVYLIDFGRTQSSVGMFGKIGRFFNKNGDKNGGVLYSFSERDTKNIILKIKSHEERWRSDHFNDKLSVVYDTYVRKPDIPSLYKKLAESLTLFYSKGLFNYKQLSENASHEVRDLDLTQAHSRCYEGKIKKQFSPTSGHRWVTEYGLLIPLSGAAPVVGGKSRKTRRKKSIRNKSVKRR
jgi:hypothetical protein